MTSGFSELLKAVTTALEGVRPSGTGGTQSIFMYSKHLPCLERTGFEALKYWDREPWHEVRNGKAFVDTEDPILVLFYEDETGSIVSKGEIRAVRSTIRSYFQFLWDNRRAPTCWSDAPQDLRIDFVRKLEEEFKWLRYCHRHWKSEQVFMNYYPQWYRSKISSSNKGSKRKQPADDQGNEDDCGTPSGSKRPRMEKIESTPQPIQPASIGVSGGRKKVRLIWDTIFMFVETSQDNPL